MGWFGDCNDIEASVIINVISIDAEVQRLCDEVAGLSPPADPYSLQRFTEIPAKPPGGVWIYDLSGAGKRVN